jgi:hypothetical protein
VHPHDDVVHTLADARELAPERIVALGEFRVLVLQIVEQRTRSGTLIYGVHRYFLQRR